MIVPVNATRRQMLLRNSHFKDRPASNLCKLTLFFIVFLHYFRKTDFSFVYEYVLPENNVTILFVLVSRYLPVVNAEVFCSDDAGMT